MEHVVFSAAEGGAGEEFRRVASLEEALRVVEHLRNDLGVMDPSVYALTPVPLAFRTYYRVEVPGVDLPVAEAPVAEQPIAELPIAELPTSEEPSLGDPAYVPMTAESDEFTFEPNADMSVPAILPDASAVPPSRQEDDAERSLGYFAR